MSWIAPKTTGSAPLKSYIVWVLRNNAEGHFSVPSSTTHTTVNYLDDNATYRFRVAARNSSNLIGPDSLPSRPVTPSPISQVTNTLTWESAPEVSGSVCTLALMGASGCFSLQQNFFVVQSTPTEDRSLFQTGPSLGVLAPFWVQNMVMFEKNAVGRWVAHPRVAVLRGLGVLKPGATWLCAGSTGYAGCQGPVGSVVLTFPTTITLRSVVSTDKIRFYDSLLGPSPFFTWTERPPPRPSKTPKVTTTTKLGKPHYPKCILSGNGCPGANKLGPPNFYPFKRFNIVWNPDDSLYFAAPEAVLVGEGGGTAATFFTGTQGSMGSELRLSNGTSATQTVCALSPDSAWTAETGNSLQWSVSSRGIARFEYQAGALTEGVSFLPQSLPCQDTTPRPPIPVKPPRLIEGSFIIKGSWHATSPNPAQFTGCVGSGAFREMKRSVRVEIYTATGRDSNRHFSLPYGGFIDAAGTGGGFVCRFAVGVVDPLAGKVLELKIGSVRPYRIKVSRAFYDVLDPLDRPHSTPALP